MSNELSKSGISPFERIKRINEYGAEYWSARELMLILEYTEYRNFLTVINKAMKACENSSENTLDHFGQVNEMVDIGSNSKRKRENYYLSRYACYLIVQNADSSKEVVALGQTYFAIQTRKQELFESLSEDDRRLYLRNEMKEHNSKLADAARNAGVTEQMDFAIFQNHGYKGLYGGLDARAIHERKGLGKSQNILDHMGSTELAANLFRATQTEEKLRRENIKGKENANRTHYEVGKKVRKTIEELGGTMPENLPTYKSIKEIEKKKIGLLETDLKLRLKPVKPTFETLEQVAVTVESEINPVPEEKWTSLLQGLKNQGRFVLYTNLLASKAELQGSTLFIRCGEKSRFNIMIINRREHAEFLVNYFSSNLDRNIKNIVATE